MTITFTAETSGATAVTNATRVTRPVPTSDRRVPTSDRRAPTPPTDGSVSPAVGPTTMARLAAGVLTAFFTIRAVAERSLGRLGARLRDQRGQATTEYALVLLAAARVALLVVAWATAGGGGARISRLFNRVVDAVIDRV